MVDFIRVNCCIFNVAIKAKYPSQKKQHIFCYAAAHMLLHARDQDLAVFLKDRFDFNNEWLGLVQQLLGDTPGSPGRRSERILTANVSDCGEA